jgi:hypothetical protein
VPRCTAVRFVTSGHQGDPWWSFVFRQENSLQLNLENTAPAAIAETPAINAVFASEAWLKYVKTGNELVTHLNEKEKARLV